MNASSLDSAGLTCATSAWRFRLLASATLLCLSFTAAAAQAPPASGDYTQQLPSVQRIETEIKGADATDTLARQIAVFEYLQFYIQNIKYARTVRGPYSPGEQKILTDYAKAQNDLTQSYTKTHTTAQVTDFNRLVGRYQLNNAYGWVKPMLGSQVTDTYAGAESTLGQSYQRNQDRIQKGLTEQGGGSSAAHDALLNPLGIFGGDTANDPETRRCLELGSTADECQDSGLAGMGKAVEAMASAFVGKDPNAGRPLSGVILVGSYHSRTDLPEIALTWEGKALLQKCGTLVDDNHRYEIRKSGAATQIILENEPNPIVLTVRPDGSLSGPGNVAVKGNVLVGYNNQYSCTTGTAAANCRTTSMPVYSPSMQRCTLSQLAPQPAPPPPAKPTGALGQINEMLAVGHPVATIYGFRIVGAYASPTGMVLSFDNRYATVDCGQAHARVPYKVEDTPSGFVVHVQNGGGAFLLEVASNNTLRGSGSTTVSGRLVTGVKDDNVSFRPVSATCDVGTFSSKSADEYKALLAHMPPPSRGAAGAPVEASSGFWASGYEAGAAAPGSGARAPMQVVITSRFPAGRNPLAGQIVSIRREPMSSVLRKLGVSVPANASPAQALQSFLASCHKIDCRAVVAGLKAYDVANIRLDAHGGYTVNVNETTGPYFFYSMVHLPDGTFTVWEVPANLHAGENSIVFQGNNGEPLKLDVSALR